jgi:S-adenosylmethionine:tRNA ribosyltransferase-isomerase
MEAELVAAVERPRPLEEARGPIELLEPHKTRDGVRLLVTPGDGGNLTHAQFTDLPDLLERGDVVVANDSAVLPAALPADLRGERLRLHVSSPVPGTPRRLVELRVPDGLGSAPFTFARAGDIVDLPDGGSAQLVAPRLRSGKPSRLWEAELVLPHELLTYLDRHGEPIRYGYVSQAWGIASYQTMFAHVPGSSEMPSAGRPFSPRVVRRLRARGVSVVTVTLHAGVASLERDEQPSPEPFRVTAATAAIANAALAAGRRVIAVGTTVVRALETATDAGGKVHAADGVTGLIVEPSRELRSISGLLTGFHEPEASHLKLLEAVAGADAVTRSYEAALDRAYRWHEFGDVHLVLRPDA